MRQGPLRDIRVVDLTTAIMGPYATQQLADLSADVIAIEAKRGNTTRTMGRGPHPQLSGTALNLLRNKRNIYIDFQSETGREVLHRLIASADVLVTSLREASLRRAGVSWDVVSRLRPDIVYCQAQGFPNDSPQAKAPAYDDVIQAAAGVPDLFSRVDGVLRYVPSALADKVCGTAMANAVLAALYRRAVTGRGEHVQISMLAALESFLLVEHGLEAIPEPKMGPPGYDRMTTPLRRPYRTLDGWIALMPYSKENYNAIFGEFGRPELVDDPRFATGVVRIKNSAALYELLEQVVTTATTERWRSFAERRGVPFAEVATLDEVVDGLPLVDHPVVGRYRYIPPPARFGSYDPATELSPAPLIGQDTIDVLHELGYDDDAVEQLAADGLFPEVPAEFRTSVPAEDSAV